MYGYDVGTLVKARRRLDPSGANVAKGTLGVVFEPTQYVKNAGTWDEAGPMHGGHVECGPCVRWVTGAVCNVYPGDVTTDDVRCGGFVPACVRADSLLGERAPSRHGRVEVRAWLWTRINAADRRHDRRTGKR